MSKQRAWDKMDVNHQSGQRAQSAPTVTPLTSTLGSRHTRGYTDDEDSMLAALGATSHRSAEETSPRNNASSSRTSVTSTPRFGGSASSTSESEALGSPTPARRDSMEIDAASSSSASSSSSSVAAVGGAHLHIAQRRQALGGLVQTTTTTRGTTLARPLRSFPDSGNQSRLSDLPDDAFALISTHLDGLAISTLWTAADLPLQRRLERAITHFEGIAPCRKDSPCWPSFASHFKKLLHFRICDDLIFQRVPIPRDTMRLVSLERLQTLEAPLLNSSDLICAFHPHLKTLILHKPFYAEVTWPRQLPATLTALRLSTVSMKAGQIGDFVRSLPGGLLHLTSSFHLSDRQNALMNLPKTLETVDVMFEGENLGQVGPLPSTLVQIRIGGLGAATGQMGHQINGMEVSLPDWSFLPQGLTSLQLSNIGKEQLGRLETLPRALRSLDVGACPVTFDRDSVAFLPGSLTSLSGLFALLDHDAPPLLPPNLSILDICPPMDYAFSSHALEMLPKRLTSLRLLKILSSCVSALPKTLTHLDAPLEYDEDGSYMEYPPKLVSWKGMAYPSEWTEEPRFPETLKSFHCETSILSGPFVLTYFPSRLSEFRAIINTHSYIVYPPEVLAWSQALPRGLETLSLACHGRMFVPSWGCNLPPSLTSLKLTLLSELPHADNALHHLPKSLLHLAVKLKYKAKPHLWPLRLLHQGLSSLRISFSKLERSPRMLQLTMDDISDIPASLNILRLPNPTGDDAAEVLIRLSQLQVQGLHVLIDNIPLRVNDGIGMHF